MKNSFFDSYVIPGRMGAIYLLLLTLVFTSCANIQSPMGGPKDSLPPKLIKVEPAENSTNVQGSVVRFSFDEYISLQNLNENLIINPPAEKFPIIVSKLRNLSVKLLDTLQPNTTYSINFGNAVVDVNEGNPLRNFNYAFSTGPYIDSLEITGSLLDAETGLPDSTQLIILHVSETDSAVAKKKPRFVTRPNGRGVFRFDHLPAGNFYIFALKDEGVKRYTSNQIPFAFYDTTVAAGSSDSIRLRSFIAEKEPEKKTKIATQPGRTDKDKKEDKKLKYVVSASTSSQDLLTPLTIVFEKKIKTLDTSKILLTDTLQNLIAGYQVSMDSTGTILSLSNNWKYDENYQLLLVKGFAADSLGATTTRNDTIFFKSKAESEYGNLKLKISGVDMSRHPVLQFTENNAVTFSAPLTGNIYTNKLFKPGQYALRILYDSNQNGLWDTGNYWKKIQPEFVLPVEMTISVKANYENELEINL
ncbi:MAG: Ig-like domain-containing protein [Bacteroidota bacterium]